MVTIRCTRKLLRRLAFDPAAPASDTVLGDWYANILFARPEQVVLCVSERTLLPVVVTARTASTLGVRLADALLPILLNLGVRSEDARAEVAKMRECAFAPTRSRRVLGTVSDFMRQLRWYLQAHPEASLQQASAWLGETPCGPIDYDVPDRLTMELFAGLAGAGARRQ